MNIKIKRLNITDELKCLLLSFLVIVGTFPDNDWSFSVGIDPPLEWAFNYLFENGLGIGKHIIFPHGPLAFFMYPLQENILLSTMVTSLLKSLLVFNVIWLFAESKNQTKWIVSFLVAYFVSIIAGFTHLILTNILLLYCNSYLSSNKAYKYLAFLITSFAFFVKVYVAIISIILSLSFILYSFYRNKSIKRLLIDSFLLLGLIMMFWFFMYGTFNGFISYIWGMLHLANDNSSATAYYPYNNWIVLLLMSILLLLIFLINRTKESLFYGMLIALSLFAAWKHGMGREDIYHVNGFFTYTIICLLVFIMFYKKNIYTNSVLSIFAVFLFSVNMINSVNYFSSKKEIFRVNNFIEFISEFSELKQNSIKNTQSKTSVNKLPQKILDVISNSTVDVYPWDYSIIAINNLNWQPRVIIQSYASYTTWLDKRNAEHFKSEYAPDYLIWESDKISRDVNGGDINSIDNRYLLNDEPHTILQLLMNYDHYYSENKFHLFKKRIKPISAINKLIKYDKSSWGEWIEVPEFEGVLLRAKLQFSNTLLQGIKRFLYKDEQFWIYLKLKNGSIHKYRIVPENAIDGLWINPYIFNFDKAYTVDKIMFKCSNQGILTNKITINWEQFEFKDNPGCTKNFFSIKKFSEDSTILYSINEYEKPFVKNWNDLTNEQFYDISFEGMKSHLVKANSYSSTFLFKLDSFPFQDMKITADCWVKTPRYKLSNNISLVLTVEDEKGFIICNNISIDGQLLDRNQWNNIFSFIDYPHNNANCTFKAYFWNRSNNEILIDNFRIMILDSNKQ